MLIDAIIEIPAFSIYKYEIGNDGLLTLDRVLNQHVPYSYGFVPETVAEDGDALDAFIISNQAIPPLTKVKIKVVRVALCMDSGTEDHKLIGILDGEATVVNYDTIATFLSTYKKGFEFKGFAGLEEAEAVLRTARTRRATNVN